MCQFPAALPAKLTQQLAGNRDGLPVKVFAQDETRLGLQPILRLMDLVTDTRFLKGLRKLFPDSI